MLNSEIKGAIKVTNTRPKLQSIYKTTNLDRKQTKAEFDLQNVSTPSDSA
jgi:hypothetical protein